MYYEARHSNIHGYWFVDKVEAGEGFSVLTGLTEEAASAAAEEMNEVAAELARVNALLRRERRKRRGRA